MTYTDSIVTILTADATFNSLATGGAYAFQKSGRKGLNRVQVMKAFQDKVGGGLIKPTVIIYEVETHWDGQAVGPMLGYRSTVTTVIGWIYAEGDQGFDTIDAIEQRMYQLLEGTPIPGAFQVLWGNTPKNRRENLLDDAGFYQFSMRVHGFRQK